MPTPSTQEILRARMQIEAAIRFLRGGRESELHLIEPIEMGAIHALDWALGLAGGEWFLRHLTALRQIERNLTEGISDGGDGPG
jgi:hypothetical protein